MLILLFCTAVTLAMLWPETPPGRLLRRWLVELPARKLAELTAGKVLFLLLFVLFIAAAVMIAKTEGAIFLAQGVPEGIAWFATFDIATYLDVIAVALLLGATVRLRAVYAALRAWVARSRFQLRRGQRSARTRSRRAGRRAAPPPSNDDEPAWPGMGVAFG